MLVPLQINKFDTAYFDPEEIFLIMPDIRGCQVFFRGEKDALNVCTMTALEMNSYVAHCKEHIVALRSSES